MPNQKNCELAVKFTHELGEFASMHEISERETEVFLLLLNGVTTSSDIGAHLSLSPNTVSNHLKSILTKTSTHSKTEAVAAYAQHCTAKLQSIKFFAKRPLVLVIDDDEDFCYLAREELEKRGIRALTETDPFKARAVMVSTRPDAIISDIHMPDMLGTDLVKGLKADVCSKSAYLMITGFEDYSLSECQAIGATELFYKPFDFTKLAFAIMENFIENPHVKNRFLRVPCEIDCSINNGFKAQITNISYDGMFIAVDESKIKRLTAFQLGKNTEITFQLSQRDNSITMPGKVSWLRKKSAVNLPTGAGIKFIAVNTKDQEMIKDFVRSNKKLPQLVDLK